MTTDWMLYAGARSVEMRVSLDWHEHRNILKFSFPLDVQNPVPTYEILTASYLVRRMAMKTRPAVDRCFR